jgi:hypothetical protein
MFTGEGSRAATACSPVNPRGKRRRCVPPPGALRCGGSGQEAGARDRAGQPPGPTGALRSCAGSAPLRRVQSGTTRQQHAPGMDERLAGALRAVLRPDPALPYGLATASDLRFCYPCLGAQVRGEGVERDGDSGVAGVALAAPAGTPHITGRVMRSAVGQSWARRFVRLRRHAASGAAAMRSCTT